MHTRIPLALETLGPSNAKGISFFNEIGHRLSARSGELRETAFLLSSAFQSLSNALTASAFTAASRTKQTSTPTLKLLRHILSSYLSPSGTFATEGIKNNNNNNSTYKVPWQVEQATEAETTIKRFSTSGRGRKGK
jgi:hypothetical protein